jgi:quinolinate synthase
MKLNTLEKIYLCLKEEINEVLVPEKLATEALKPLNLMLEWSK